eukprot:672555-Pyramimonas_sp.AAC.1
MLKSPTLIHGKESVSTSPPRRWKRARLCPVILVLGRAHTILTASEQPAKFNTIGNNPSNPVWSDSRRYPCAALAA